MQVTSIRARACERGGFFFFFLKKKKKKISPCMALLVIKREPERNLVRHYFLLERDCRANKYDCRKQEPRSNALESFHLFIAFQFSGGLSGSHFPVARLMGTLKMAVDVSAAIKSLLQSIL